ncbi:DUF1559 family PulG-like putative transporter [Frigoriglobus tundricola]|uniref:DUF1559 domain-containing protein n=1 Tax=Frigoriglobus tundricola TaxID=2774151 RepID=A0A6M5Z1S3_9BACT|nr:DUF1559 domain-containing protein [Frigoriglobus tundricola]QJW99453.1 hypothetical protein FTUN_7065 [Frigoriglobus tundricola]
MRRTLSPRGATLPELLVVIAIIGTLLALLLPGVQRVREAAARMSCLNNLKQIGLACQNYHSAHETLPPGGVGSGQQSTALPSSSWFLHIAPFFEQQAVWDQAVADYNNPAVTLLSQHRGSRALLAVLECPSDGRLRTLQGGRFFSSFDQAAYTDYVGVTGTNIWNRDGVLFTGSAIKLEHIGDGTSNTLLCSERPPQLIGDIGVWYVSSNITPDVLLGSSDLVLFQWGTNCVSGPYHFGPGQLTNPCDDYHFWSLHPGGANFAFCDGSVKFLKYSAVAILPALATRSGGEVITGDY